MRNCLGGGRVTQDLQQTAYRVPIPVPCHNLDLGPYPSHVHHDHARQERIIPPLLHELTHHSPSPAQVKLHEGSQVGKKGQLLLQPWAQHHEVIPPICVLALSSEGVPLVDKG